MEHLIKFCMKRLYSKSYMVFQSTPWHMILGGIERSNQGHWVFIQLRWAHIPCIIRQRSSQAERPLVWRHDEGFVVMTYFWHHNELFWCNDVFLTSWRSFYRHDLFLTSWRTFDAMTNVFDVMTCFWCQDENCFVMTWFWRHDEQTFWRHNCN